MTTISWNPTTDQKSRSRLGQFSSWLGEHPGINLATYRELWQWSVDDVSAFWHAVCEYFEVIGENLHAPALAEDRMPGAVWYPTARLNYAENVLRHARGAHATSTALIEVLEDGTTRALTWRDLESLVANFADSLRRLGVAQGDRVVAVLPNTADAIVGLLASASIGAVWSISSPELSTSATLSRLRQLDPAVLVSVLGFEFNGKEFDNSSRLAEIEAGLPTLRATIVARTVPESALPISKSGRRWLTMEELCAGEGVPSYSRLPFDHPLWVLFSSGTTGDPKGIVHGHGGIILESLKSMGLNQDLGSDDLFFVAANTSWMVWNTLVNTLATGSAVLCYPGSPTFERPDRLFQLIADHGVTMFASGAAYLALVERSGAQPRRDFDLTRLRSIMSTGSPLQLSTWAWVHEAVSRDVHLGSDSGGTDICSGFIGSNPLEPVHFGELQGPELGVAVQAWDDGGERLIGAMGEMVILRPLPSMPLYFWGDANGERYRDAYFDKSPGVWTHGDWITETQNGGFLVHGRSDATLNRDGVRLGSTEIYSALRAVSEIRDSLVIGVERPDGSYYLPLFVTLADGQSLTDDLKDRTRAAIRQNASPRHVPDEIMVAPAIPVTHAGKKVEVQVKKLFAGIDPARAISRGALANPEAIDWFIQEAQRNLGS